MLRVEIDRVEQLRSRPVLTGSAWIVDSRAEELTRYVARGSELLTRVLERATRRTGELRAQLRALSPQGTLDRGYAIAHRVGGEIVRTPDQAPAGTELVLTLANGAVDAVSAGAHDAK
jgi:exodeoxyribonuclease VII large subunit